MTDSQGKPTPGRWQMQYELDHYCCETDVPGKFGEPESERFEALVKKMGDAGYCNYDARRLYLEEAYALGQAARSAQPAQPQETHLFSIIRKALHMLDEAIEKAGIPTHQAPELAVRLSAVRHVLMSYSGPTEESLTLRKFRVALQRIEDPEGCLDCLCEHDDEDCCEVVGEFCPHCIAGKALAAEAQPSQTEPKEKL